MLNLLDNSLSPEAQEYLKSSLKMTAGEKFNELLTSNTQINLIANIQ